MILRAANLGARLKWNWERVNYQLAKRYRACLRKVRFVGITGSERGRAGGLGIDCETCALASQP
jgi:hypothetical protein